MVTLRIRHHAVPQFDAWKRAFDGDPLDRKASGVRRYRVFRGVTDPNLVMVDLEFETLAEAEALLAKLHRLWAGPGGAVTREPQTWIVETVESENLV